MGRSLPKGWRHRPSPPAWPGGEPKLKTEPGPTSRDSSTGLSRLAAQRPLGLSTSPNGLLPRARTESRVQMNRAPEVSGGRPCFLCSPYFFSCGRPCFLCSPYFFSGGRPCFLCSPYFFLLCSGGHDFQASEKDADKFLV